MTATINCLTRADLSADELAELKEKLGTEVVFVDELQEEDAVDVYDVVDEIAGRLFECMRDGLCAVCERKYPGQWSENSITSIALLPGWALHEMYDRDSRRIVVLGCPECEVAAMAISYGSLPNQALAG